MPELVTDVVINALDQKRDAAKGQDDEKTDG